MDDGFLELGAQVDAFAGGARKVIDGIADALKKLRAAQGITPAIDLARLMLNRAEAKSDRALVQGKIASLYFDEGMFAECLSELDAAAKLAQDSPEVQRQDMNLGFMRALSLVRLDRLDEARKLLSEIEKWPGEKEQRARALFLVGWIHLQNSEQSEAASVFRNVIDKYAGTTLAVKATELLHNMEKQG